MCRVFAFPACAKKATPAFLPQAPDRHYPSSMSVCSAGGTVASRQNVKSDSDLASYLFLLVIPCHWEWQVMIANEFEERCEDVDILHPKRKLVRTSWINVLNHMDSRSPIWAVSKPYIVKKTRIPSKAPVIWPSAIVPVWGNCIINMVCCPRKDEKTKGECRSRCWVLRCRFSNWNKNDWCSDCIRFTYLKCVIEKFKSPFQWLTTFILFC